MSFENTADRLPLLDQQGNGWKRNTSILKGLLNATQGSWFTGFSLNPFHEYLNKNLFIVLRGKQDISKETFYNLSMV